MDRLRALRKRGLSDVGTQSLPSRDYRRTRAPTGGSDFIDDWGKELINLNKRLSIIFIALANAYISDDDGCYWNQS